MSKEIEEWRPVVGYEGLYEVSDWGRVRSLDRIIEQRGKNGKTFKRRFNGIILKKVVNCYGYHVVALHDEEHKQKEGKVHRLVADAFIPNPENKSEVGHLKTLPDGTEDKTANEAWNLAWMTREENANYGTICERLSEGKKGEKNPNWGIKRSEESRRKQSETNKKLYKEHPERLDAFMKSDKHTEKYKIKIIQLDIETGESIRIWDSAADAERALGIPHSNIAKVCKGKVNSAGGYKWKYN